MSADWYLVFMDDAFIRNNEWKNQNTVGCYDWESLFGGVSSAYPSVICDPEKLSV